MPKLKLKPKAIILIISIILIVAAVFLGTLYLVLHNNINGIGERYRERLQRVPVINRFLPARPASIDISKLTKDELIKKYNDLMKQNEEKNQQVEEAGKEIERLKEALSEFEKETAEIEQQKKEIQLKQSKLEKERNEIDEYRKQVDELLIKGDIEGFKEFYESISPEVSEKAYYDIIAEQEKYDKIKKLAQLYEKMEPKAAAGIFEEMGENELDLIAEALLAMKEESSAGIMAEMTPAFASKVTIKINSLLKEGS